MRVNKTVNTGPVLPNKVALAIEVFLTPKKKHAKCKPKKTPAIIVKEVFVFERGFSFLIVLYPQRSPLAVNILQKASAKAGKSAKCRIIIEVELTDSRAKPKIK